MHITQAPLQSSFLSCEKDAEIILRKLFVDNRAHSKTLKRLLVIPNSDCLDNISNPDYKQAEDMTLKNLIDKGYVITGPKIRFNEHEDIKAYILISFGTFTPNVKNPEYRDCLVHFDIICNSDCWDLGNYRLRPLKIAGYIDGLLNNARLSGIGTFKFVGCEEFILNESLSGYTLSYWAIHGGEDLETYDN